MSLLVCAVVASAQASQPAATSDWRAAGESLLTEPADPRLAAALRQVSAPRIRETIVRLVNFGTRNTLSSMDTDLPPGRGIAAAADWIEAEFRAISRECGGCLAVRRDTFLETPRERIPRPTRITNIYAVLPGSDPAQAARRLLVTGHYDSRATDVLDSHAAAPGANDDASGVAVSLECARVLSKLRPPATVVFVAVAGEEQGLNGSAQLAKLAHSEGWRLEAVLDDDIVGGNSTPGDHLQDLSAVRVFSEGIPAAADAEQRKVIEAAGYESDSPSRELARAVLAIGASYAASLDALGSAGANGAGPMSQETGPMSQGADPRSQGADPTSPHFHAVLEFRRDRFLRGGDHSSFNAQGFPAVRFTEWREDYRHQHQNVRLEHGIQYGDLPEFVDMDYVARVAGLNAAVLGTLALAPPPPQAVRILTGEPENDTTLTWQAAPGAPPDTHYQVLWRETSSAQWQRLQNVSGSALTIRLPISKDNVVFGVRSSDDRGHASYAVVPFPDR